MTNPFRTRGAMQFGLLLGRLPIGATFLLAGIYKVSDLGVKKFVEANTAILPTFMPKPVGQTYLYALPFMEMLVGSCLILGLLTRVSAFVASLMLISFIIAATGVFIHGNLLQPQSNVAYVGLTLLLTMLGGGSLSADRAIWGLEDSY